MVYEEKKNAMTGEGRKGEGGEKVQESVQGVTKKGEWMEWNIKEEKSLTEKSKSLREEMFREY